MTIEQ